MNRATRRTVFVLCGIALAALLVPGCKASNKPITEPSASAVGTGTVQAPLPDETETVTATESVEPTKPAEAAPTIWPSKVGRFAKSQKKMPVWYPAVLPKGFKIKTLDIVQLDKNTGLICDILYLKSETPLFFTQGSPKNRAYEVVASEKVPWGSETASVARMDPADPNSPQVIVYSKGGNFAELSGEVSLDQLKAIAASMVRVK